jgi:hypothetical protein
MWPPPERPVSSRTPRARRLPAHPAVARRLPSRAHDVGVSGSGSPWPDGHRRRATRHHAATRASRPAERMGRRPSPPRRQRTPPLPSRRSPTPRASSRRGRGRHGADGVGERPCPARSHHRPRPGPRPVQHRQCFRRRGQPSACPLPPTPRNPASGSGMRRPSDLRPRDRCPRCHPSHRWREQPTRRGPGPDRTRRPRDPLRPGRHPRCEPRHQRPNVPGHGRPDDAGVAAGWSRPSRRASGWRARTWRKERSRPQRSRPVVPGPYGRYSLRSERRGGPVGTAGAGSVVETERRCGRACGPALRRSPRAGPRASSRTR